ncbi:hypothetical protein [Palleronia caenipelagi]|uniref:Uncharacterized protein n=1 Tax=Palleronia caenipelagi TaxID=2489174 RepID=A0A547PUH1_9RHOB|nr:hypothetical protein [Palleronia caenipelagi]TRD17741.1 hypothetical protein FEV53_12760 [Palleronia caenipelagi]
MTAARWRLAGFLVLSLSLSGLAAPAAAQTIEPTADNRFTILRSNLVVRIEDWPRLRRQLLTAWGLTELPEIPFGEIGAMGTSEMELFTVITPALEILSLRRPPLDSDILYELGRLYTDISPDRIDEFTKGVVIEITNRIGDSAEVATFFFAEAPTPLPLPDPSPPLEIAKASESMRCALPEDAKLVLKQFRPDGGGIYRYETAEAVPSLIERLLASFLLLGLVAEVRDVDEATMLRAANLFLEILVLIEVAEDSGLTSVMYIFRLPIENG